jgi:hypothetical protein
MTISIYGPVTTPAASGGAGAAAATKVTPDVIRGEIVGIAIQYNDAPPAGTTDVGIKAKGLSGVLPSYNILTIANAATDGYFAPRKACVDASNAAITNSHAPFAINDYVQLDIAQANDGDSVTIWLYLDK